MKVNLKNFIILPALMLALTAALACFSVGTPSDSASQDAGESRSAPSPADAGRADDNAGRSGDANRDERSGGESQQNDDDRQNNNARDSESGESRNASGQRLADIPKAEEYRRRCQFWALEELDPLVYAEFAKLDPKSMDDLDRILWFSKLNPEEHWQYDDSDDAPYQWPFCHEYWSEPLNSGNAHLRNYRFERDCRNYLGNNITKAYGILTGEANSSLANEADNQGSPEDTDLVFQTPNQYVRLLQWLDLSGEDLLNSDNPPYRILRQQSLSPYAYEYVDPAYNGRYDVPDQKEIKEYNEENDISLDLEWLGIINAAGIGNDYNDCALFYPQLFFGYWIPFEPESSSNSSRDDEPEPPKYDAATMPLYLPKSVRDERVPQGYPLGRAESRYDEAEYGYYTCRDFLENTQDAEKVGYYYVRHPTGDYCERIP